MKKVLAGAKLTGGNPKNGRAENDFYATNPEAVKMLLDAYEFRGKKFLEPCVGAGHIAETIKQYFVDVSVHSIDSVDRGYESTEVVDFLTYETDEKYDAIITNPPFSLAKEFVEKGMELLRDNGQMAMFLRIQFLEGVLRDEMYSKFPPKYVYVFRKRMPVWNNGNELNPEGKPWSSTLCFAWFVWEKGSTSEPVIRWL